MEMPSSASMSLDATVTETLSTIAKLVPPRLARPRVGIVCGSGLSGLVENLRDVVSVEYNKLQGFACSTGVFTTALLSAVSEQ